MNIERGSEAPVAPYGTAAQERWLPEPDKRPGRTAFQRDRARVLHSAALRRLADTTQVVAPGEHDFPRTRLTHSLECAQVGRELGAALGCDPDLVETACLAHDLGHPPFGHNGERVLDEFAAACGGFEGNAQSLRILTRLEPKRFAPKAGSGPLVGDGSGEGDDAAGDGPEPGRPVGLNLTRAALDAATKYPWPRQPGNPKFGVYDDDLAVFQWMRGPLAATDRTRSFEAQVMDWSDDVAYCVHDFEDAFQAGHVTGAALGAPAERAELLALAAERYLPAGTDPAEAGAALDRLRALDYWPHHYDGTARAQAALKDAASELIGRFCVAAEVATRARFGPGRPVGEGAELVVPDGTRLEAAVLKAVAARYVMQRPEQSRLRIRQRELLSELATALCASAPHGLGPLFREAWDRADDDAARLRVVIDRIASLTDTSARMLHSELTG
jgi:dGTPase